MTRKKIMVISEYNMGKFKETKKIIEISEFKDTQKLWR